jgi:hypothetical protein
MHTDSTSQQREPTLFCIPEEAHFELVKLREHLRLMARLVEPGTAASDHDAILRPNAMSWLVTRLWRDVDEILQATYWSADHAVDVEEAHVRIAAIRERNRELLGVAE